MKQSKRSFSFAVFAVALPLVIGAAMTSRSMSYVRAQSQEGDGGPLERGDYKTAIGSFEKMLAADHSNRNAQLGLVTAYIAIGDYKSAETNVRKFASSGSVPNLQNLLGEVFLQTGKYDEARDVFARTAAESKGEDWLRATLGQARALIARGKEDDAQKLLNQFVAYYSSNNPQSAGELTVIAKGMALLERFKDANDLYQAARKADARYLEAYVGQGELLTEKYQYGDAASLFSDALKLNHNSAEAHLGLALSKRFDSSGISEAEVDQALKVNPNYADALALKAQLQLEDERPDVAAALVKQALAANPNCTDAIAVKGAITYLTNDRSALDAEIARALAVNPHAGYFYDILAHFSIMNRRYADAVSFETKAVELSPHLWSARTELGIELLRIGKETEGRAELEKAFEGDPYNVWAKNSLDLLDSMREFKVTNDGPFVIKNAPKDAGAVATYAGPLLESAYKTLTEKYHFTPDGPITVEIFPNHEDFAVRSLGLPGLGALGVCFGKVIAMDSPSAREKDEFNWGSTLWHEFTHVITLQMTAHRIPRWFSEGLSVYEERHARPGWGDRWNVDTIQAYNHGQFVKIADLDAAFTRPQSPDSVPLAYFQASLVCDFVEQKFGFDAVLRMLALYKNGEKTPGVLQQALKLSEADFDSQFDQFVKGQIAAYAEPIANSNVAAGMKSKEELISYLKAHPKDYFAHLRLGDTYTTENQLQQAADQFKEAIQLFPLYHGNGNPYIKLADVYEKMGRKPDEIKVLSDFAQVSDTGYDALNRLASLRRESGDEKGSLDALLMAAYIFPYDPAMHKTAGDLYLKQNDAAGAAREYQVAVSLDPPDQAGAHYDLASALFQAGRLAEARREVLKSLEAAPEFDKAQTLLLKLHSNN